MTPTLGGWVLRDLSITLVIAAVCTAFVLWFKATGSFIPAVLGAVVGFKSAYVLCYIFHEWGHQAGGVLAGAHMPVNPYRGILLGQFDIAAHSPRQFIWLSWGGIAGYLATATLLLWVYFSIELDWLGAGLAVGALAFVFQSLSVDLPQVFRVLAGSDPLETNRQGASAAMIIRRTWQSWTVLAILVLASNFLR